MEKFGSSIHHHHPDQQQPQTTTVAVTKEKKADNDDTVGSCVNIDIGNTSNSRNSTLATTAGAAAAGGGGRGGDSTTPTKRRSSSSLLKNITPTRLLSRRKKKENTNQNSRNSTLKPTTTKHKVSKTYSSSTAASAGGDRNANRSSTEKTIPIIESVVDGGADTAALEVNSSSMPVSPFGKMEKDQFWQETRNDIDNSVKKMAVDAQQQHQQEAGTPRSRPSPSSTRARSGTSPTSATPRRAMTPPHRSRPPVNGNDTSHGGVDGGGGKTNINVTPRQLNLSVEETTTTQTTTSGLTIDIDTSDTVPSCPGTTTSQQQKEQQQNTQTQNLTSSRSTSWKSTTPTPTTVHQSILQAKASLQEYIDTNIDSKKDRQNGHSPNDDDDDADDNLADKSSKVVAEPIATALKELHQEMGQQLLVIQNSSSSVSLKSMGHQQPHSPTTTATTTKAEQSQPQTSPLSSSTSLSRSSSSSTSIAFTNVVRDDDDCDEDDEQSKRRVVFQPNSQLLQATEELHDDDDNEEEAVGTMAVVSFSTSVVTNSPTSNDKDSTKVAFVSSFPSDVPSPSLHNQSPQPPQPPLQQQHTRSTAQNNSARTWFGLPLEFYLLVLVFIGMVVTMKYFAMLVQPPFNKDILIPRAQQFVTGGDEELLHRLLTSPRSSKPLKGMVVILSETTSGLGSNIAHGFSSLGATVTSLHIDCYDLNSVSESVDSVLDAFERVDFVINTGNLCLWEPMATTMMNTTLSLTVPTSINVASTNQGYDTLFGGNYLGPFLMIQKLLPYLERSKFGTLVQFASPTSIFADTDSYRVENDDHHVVSIETAPTVSKPLLHGGYMESLATLPRRFADIKLAEILHVRTLKRIYATSKIHIMEISKDPFATGQEIRTLFDTVFQQSPTNNVVHPSNNSDETYGISGLMSKWKKIPILLLGKSVDDTTQRMDQVDEQEVLQNDFYDWSFDAVHEWMTVPSMISSMFFQQTALMDSPILSMSSSSSSGTVSSSTTTKKSVGSVIDHFIPSVVKPYLEVGSTTLLVGSMSVMIWKWASAGITDGSTE